jgi:predicted TIM-barrel fold metal-dependent hydrolase
MRKNFSAAAFIVAALLIAAPSIAHEHDKPIGDEIKNVPIFDAHVHYKEPAWGPYPPKSVIELMDASGVAMALVSSTPDEGTIKLWQFAPQRVVPELRPYHGKAGSSNWTTAPGMAAYLRQRLAAYPHKGIGEFHLHSIDPADEPLLREVAAMAKERNIPVHIHSGAEPVRLMFRLEPSLTIIWAHAGMTEPADVVETLMTAHAKLFADTSYRERDILNGDGSIDPGWRRVIERFPDRFMVGSDTWVNAQWDVYGELISINRRWLSRFPRKIAEQIAFRNAEALFGRKISPDLIGKR